MIFYKKGDTATNVRVPDITFPVPLEYAEDAVSIETGIGHQFKYELGFPELIITLALKNLTVDKMDELAKFFIDKIQFKNKFVMGFEFNEVNQLYFLKPSVQIERLDLGSSATIDSVFYHKTIEDMRWDGSPEFRGRLNNFGLNTVTVVAKKKLRSQIPTIEVF